MLRFRDMQLVVFVPAVGSQDSAASSMAHISIVVAHDALCPELCPPLRRARGRTCLCSRCAQGQERSWRWWPKLLKNDEGGGRRTGGGGGRRRERDGATSLIEVGIAGAQQRYPRAEAETSGRQSTLRT